MRPARTPPSTSRVLTVSLSALEIEDGSIPPPRIGFLTTLWLDFYETSDVAPGAATVAGFGRAKTCIPSTAT